ncbi:MAG: hypothetical protein ABI618_16490 [Nitrospirota bacterium]
MCIAKLLWFISLIRDQSFVMDGISGDCPETNSGGNCNEAAAPYVSRHQPVRVIKEISRRETHTHRESLANHFVKKGKTGGHDRQHLPIKEVVSHFQETNRGSDASILTGALLGWNAMACA